jgi:hypothetical protein
MCWLGALKICLIEYKLTKFVSFFILNYHQVAGTDRVYIKLKITQGAKSSPAAPSLTSKMSCTRGNNDKFIIIPGRHFNSSRSASVFHGLGVFIPGRCGCAGVASQTSYCRKRINSKEAKEMMETKGERLGWIVCASLRGLSDERTRQAFQSATHTHNRPSNGILRVAVSKN